jgi:hypothetical protein
MITPGKVKKVQNLWEMISKKVKGIKFFKAKPKEAPKPKGWRNEGAYETEAAAKEATARANRAEKTQKSEASATRAQREKVEEEAKLRRSEEDLRRAEQGEPPRSDKPPKTETPGSEAPRGTDRRAADPKPEPAAATGRGGDRRRADDAKPEPKPEAAKPEPKPEAAPKPRRGERRKQKLQDAAEIKSLKEALKTPTLRKWKRRIVVGAGLYGGWHLATSSIEWAKENPKEWDKMKKALSGFEHVPGAAEAAVGAVPKILSEAGTSIMENVEDAVRGVQDYARGASKRMDEGIPVAKTPAAAKVTPKDTTTTATKDKFKDVPVPGHKPPAPSQMPKAQVKGVEPPKLISVSGAKKAPKKLTDAQKMAAVKKKHGKYSKEAGVAWGKKHGIDISYDFPGMSVKDYEEGLKAGTISKKLGISKKDKLTRAAREDIEQLSMYRHGGSVSSDSYMLRKKPRTTSEVKKGSRQSRSWNY